MTIAQEIKDIPKSEVVKIGCKSGSGFFYCDNITEDTIKHLTEASNKAFFKAIRNKRSAKNTLQNIPKRAGKDLCEMLRKEDKTEDEIVEEWEEKWQKKMQKATAKLKNAEHRANNWVHYPEREVKETYRCIRPHTIAILIKGDDNAEYWDQDEWREENDRRNA